MQVRQVQDSLDVTKKINFNDEFELVACRWKYLLKSPNPTPERMMEFRSTVTGTVRKIWRKFQYAYERTGHQLEDIRSYADIHLVSYLGLFSLAEHPEKLHDFIRKFELENGKLPTDEEILKKDQANCACFLYQRLSEVAELCSKKSCNIRGTKGTKVSFEISEDVSVPYQTLLEDPEKYGLVRLTKKNADMLERKSGGKVGMAKKNQRIYTVDDRHILVIDAPARSLTEDDVSDLFYTSENSMFIMDPLEILESMATNARDRKYKLDFENNTLEIKKRILAKFIVDHEGDSKYLVEVNAAKTMLNRLR